jgi:hypothetical protein
MAGTMRGNRITALLVAAVSLAGLAASAPAVAASHRAHHASQKALAIPKAPFGRAGDQPVEIYTLTNVHGIEAKIMTYGAAIVSLRTEKAISWRRTMGSTACMAASRASTSASGAPGPAKRLTARCCS